MKFITIFCNKCYYINRGTKELEVIMVESPESVFAIVLVIFLSIGLIAAVVGVFIFNGFNWWDKL